MKTCWLKRASGEISSGRLTSLFYISSWEISSKRLPSLVYTLNEACSVGWEMVKLWNFVNVSQSCCNFHGAFMACCWCLSWIKCQVLALTSWDVIFVAKNNASERTKSSFCFPLDWIGVVYLKLYGVLKRSKR